MSQIGVMVANPNPTVIAGQSQCEEYVLIGDVDTANILTSVQVEIDGKPFFTINSQTLISAYMKWMMEMTGATVGLLLKLATGAIKKNTTYRFTNVGATTPNILAFSDSRKGVPFIVSTKQINPNSYEDFSKFSALFITDSDDLTNTELRCADGHTATLTTVELDAWFAYKYNSEANGRLADVTVIDNRDRSLKSVRLQTGANAVTVLMAKIPDMAFKRLVEQIG